MPVIFPAVGFFARRLDNARLLRVMAVSLEQGKSLQQTLRILTMHHPRETVRRRLRVAGAMVSQGTHWIDSMKTAKILTGTEANVLRAAHEANNLSWAMHELAATGSKRFAYRFRTVLAFIFPILACLVGLVVLLVGYTVLQPIARVILELSPA